jgi:lantibiotic biosynthesis protein
MQHNKTQIWNKLFSIEKDIYTAAFESNSASLMQGIGGIPILYDNLYCATGDKVYIEKSNEIVNKIIDLLSSSISSLKYYDGLSGIALLFDYLLQRGYDSFGLDEIVEDCKNLLYETFLSEIDDLDFLHGAQGIFMLFLYQQPGKESDKRTKEMMMRIVETMNEYINNSKKGKDETKINCGMAHGIISYILILSKYLAKNDCKIVREVLYKLVNLLFETETKNKSSLSIFPSIIDYAGLTSEAEYVVPLGWCYGDNIISIGLLKAGSVLNDDFIIEKANEIAITTTKRNNVKNAIIYDACFCHGSSSIAHSYNKWYQYTGNLTFKNSYELWIDKTIEMCSFKNAIGGYKQFSGGNNYEKNIGLLDGACGVALVLTDYASGKITDWDRFFLLD